jgi:hypothetical protein
MFEKWKGTTATEVVLGLAAVVFFLKSGHAAEGGRFPEATYWLLVAVLCGFGAVRRSK